MINKANFVAFDLSPSLWPHRRNLPRFIFRLITLSKLKQGVIAGKSVQSSIAIAFQTFVRVNLGRMA